jgi:hypothetical protein
LVIVKEWFKFDFENSFGISVPSVTNIFVVKHFSLQKMITSTILKYVFRNCCEKIYFLPVPSPAGGRVSILGTKFQIRPFFYCTPSLKIWLSRVHRDSQWSCAVQTILKKTSHSSWSWPSRQCLLLFLNNGNWLLAMLLFLSMSGLLSNILNT